MAPDGRLVGELIGDADPHVVIDLPTFGQSKGGGITGGIWLDAGSVSFPSEGWNDFVVVILGWWLAELRAMPARGNPRATVRLEFMDGPYEVELSAPLAMAGPWLARFVQRSARKRVVHEVEASGRALARSIRQAALLVLVECDARGWTNGDVEALRRQLEAVRR